MKRPSVKWLAVAAAGCIFASSMGTYTYTALADEFVYTDANVSITSIVDHYIEENGGDIGIDPCLHIIFYMESAIQQLIAEYLLGGGKAGQQDPAQQGQGKQNPQGKNQVSGGKL